MKNILYTIILSFLFSSSVFGEVSILEPTQNPNAPYRLFKTKNIHTLLKLDTRSGQIWQVQWGSGGERFTTPPINDPIILHEEPGRFTLYPTDNMWTFILLDQEMGFSWHVQWSTNSKERFAYPIP